MWAKIMFSRNCRINYRNIHIFQKFCFPLNRFALHHMVQCELSVFNQNNCGGNIEWCIYWFIQPLYTINSPTARTKKNTSLEFAHELELKRLIVRDIRISCLRFWPFSWNITCLCCHTFVRHIAAVEFPLLHTKLVWCEFFSFHSPNMENAIKNRTINSVHLRNGKSTCTVYGCIFCVCGVRCVCMCHFNSVVL